MSNIVIICMVISVFFSFLLIAFAVFAIGFLIGYKHEEKRILKKSQQKSDNEIHESEEEKKAKRDWKNFLKYDGGATADNE